MIEFTKDERDMVLDALNKSRVQWVKTIDVRREMVYNPPYWRDERTREVDKDILERFYQLFSALDSAIEKLK